jgi:hypothetical protein
LQELAMRGIRAIVLPAVLLVSGLDAVPAGAQSPPQGEVAKRFFGAWRYVGTSIDGKPRPGRGSNPKGIIYYDPSGAMAAQIAPDRHVRMAGPEPTAEEAKGGAGRLRRLFRHLYDRRARGHHHASSPGERAAGRAYGLCAQLRIRG